MNAALFIQHSLRLAGAVARPGQCIARNCVWRRAVVSAPKSHGQGVAHAAHLATNHILMATGVGRKQAVELLGKRAARLEWIAAGGPGNLPCWIASLHSLNKAHNGWSIMVMPICFAPARSAASALANE